MPDLNHVPHQRSLIKARAEPVRISLEKLDGHSIIIMLPLRSEEENSFRNSALKDLISEPIGLTGADLNMAALQAALQTLWRGIVAVGLCKNHLAAH